MPSRAVIAILCALPTVAACVAPPTQSPKMGLEPPALSPPGDLDPAARLAWWEHQLPLLDSTDRAEARLAMAELELELGNAREARVDFYEAKGGHLALREAAQAERGIGLSYFLDGQVDLGVRHLERARSGLSGPALEEVDYLLAAAAGKPMESGAALESRVGRFLAAASLQVESSGPNARAGTSVHFDVSRQQWKANPMRSNWDRMTTPYRITVHHTAEPISSTALRASMAEVRNVQSQHMNARGFADIGYHFLVDRAGRVFEGRPLYAQGAHASGELNIGNIGICLLGNFAAQADRGSAYRTAQKPSTAQLESLAALLHQVQQVYDIPDRQVWGHGDLKSTECPGAELSRWVATYRREGSRG